MVGLRGLLAGLGFGRLSKPKPNNKVLVQRGHHAECFPEQVKPSTISESNHNVGGQSGVNRPISKRITQERKAYFVRCIGDSVMRRIVEDTNCRCNVFKLLLVAILKLKNWFVFSILFLISMQASSIDYTWSAPGASGFPTPQAACEYYLDTLKILLTVIAKVPRVHVVVTVPFIIYPIKSVLLAM